MPGDFASDLTMLLNSPVLLLVMMGMALGLVLLALYTTVAMRDPAAERMRAASATYGRAAKRRDLLKTPDRVPEGMLKALLPEERAERTQIRDQLRRAGFDGPNVLRNFFVLRLILATAAPVIAVLLVALDRTLGLPLVIDSWVGGLGFIAASRIVAISTAIGFWTPTLWLKRKIKRRQGEIEAGFPNALDLLQISTEAGMGFDAAMTRVGQSLDTVSPAISEEFLLCQAEILASRDRKQAMADMAERMGVEEVTAFTQVVGQSMDYGTSIARALNAYAAEMREAREMKAMEKANRLPVQMSGVMSIMMLPALFLITLGPTVLRYLSVFGE
ncbi:type II secretion system F family protein [Maritimibacter sp. UBA3975]|uniref:type II secretion system F family protein n=1 Tax=Maritimibacter sp. UBA3975 TaxID=1946833 RepID=UPI000C0B2483|nr:type II secretion system F family protein [Maritimibacter sp. UBA3975]MAM62287.1 type II secretion system protein [Maritimibacter sp.]|tara:strand:- start:9029 stop:10021 length:993 start_codon:yes stop_codon:yes gene_type:complete